MDYQRYAEENYTQKNLCQGCNVDMGVNNPRQYCCKTYCPEEEQKKEANNKIINDQKFAKEYIEEFDYYQTFALSIEKESEEEKIKVLENNLKSVINKVELIHQLTSEILKK
jgi:hypothetical protein